MLYDEQINNLLLHVKTLVLAAEHRPKVLQELLTDKPEYLKAIKEFKLKFSNGTTTYADLIYDLETELGLDYSKVSNPKLLISELQKLVPIAEYFEVKHEQLRAGRPLISVMRLITLAVFDLPSLQILLADQNVDFNAITESIKAIPSAQLSVLLENFSKLEQKPASIVAFFAKHPQLKEILQARNLNEIAKATDNLAFAANMRKAYPLIQQIIIDKDSLKSLVNTPQWLLIQAFDKFYHNSKYFPTEVCQKAFLAAIENYATEPKQLADFFKKHTAIYKYMQRKATPLAYLNEIIKTKAAVSLPLRQQLMTDVFSSVNDQSSLIQVLRMFIKLLAQGKMKDISSLSSEQLTDIIYVNLITHLSPLQLAWLKELPITLTNGEPLEQGIWQSLQQALNDAFIKMDGLHPLNPDNPFRWVDVSFDVLLKINECYQQTGRLLFSQPDDHEVKQKITAQLLTKLADDEKIVLLTAIQVLTAIDPMVNKFYSQLRQTLLPELPELITKTIANLVQLKPEPLKEQLNQPEKDRLKSQLQQILQAYYENLKTEGMFPDSFIAEDIPNLIKKLIYKLPTHGLELLKLLPVNEGHIKGDKLVMARALNLSADDLLTARENFNASFAAKNSISINSLRDSLENLINVIKPELNTNLANAEMDASYAEEAKDILYFNCLTNLAIDQLTSLKQQLEQNEREVANSPQLKLLQDELDSPRVSGLVANKRFQGRLAEDVKQLDLLKKNLNDDVKGYSGYKVYNKSLSMKDIQYVLPSVRNVVQIQYDKKQVVVDLREQCAKQQLDIQSDIDKGIVSQEKLVEHTEKHKVNFATAINHPAINEHTSFAKFIYNGLKQIWLQTYQFIAGFQGDAAVKKATGYAESLANHGMYKTKTSIALANRTVEDLNQQEQLSSNITTAAPTA
jgi:hypothetical protein